jgi:hypothetical protein
LVLFHRRWAALPNPSPRTRPQPARSAAKSPPIRTPSQSSKTAWSKPSQPPKTTGADITKPTTRLDTAEGQLGGSSEALTALSQQVDTLQTTTKCDTDTLLDLIDDTKEQAVSIRGALTTDIRSTETRLDNLEAARFDVFARAIEGIDEKVRSGYPALFEYRGLGTGMTHVLP